MLQWKEIEVKGLKYSRGAYLDYYVYRVSGKYVAVYCEVDFGFEPSMVLTERVYGTGFGNINQAKRACDKIESREEAL